MKAVSTLIHPTKKLAYISILKNASSSFGEMFKDWENGVPRINHYTFTILRNPATRFLSAFDRACERHHINKREDRLIYLEKAIKDAKNVSMPLLDEHMMRQVDCLRLDSYFIDQYFTLENIEWTWREFQTQHGLPKLVHWNERKEKDHYSEIMGRKDIQVKFWEFYGPDLKLWESIKYREEHPWE